MPRKRLSELFITKIKPPLTGRAEYFDSASPGLVLRVTSTNHKSWSLVYRFGGKLKRYTLGPYAEGKARIEFNLNAAHQKADEARALIRKGTDPAALKKAYRNGSAEAGTFKAVAQEWLERHVKKNCAFSTYAETKRIFEVDLIPKFEGRKIDSVTFHEVDSLISRIAKRDAEVQANRVLARLRAMLNWAVSQRLLTVSPIVGMKLPTKEKARDRWLSDEEILWFWRACDQIGWPFGPMFKLLLVTAQRRDEVGQAEWSEIDFEQKLWTLPRGRVKNDRGHVVHLSDAAIDVLRALPRIGKRYVFTRNSVDFVSGFSKAKDRLDAAMIEAAEGAEIPPFILHDLRWTAASGMARLNVSPHVVDRILNHTSGTIRGVSAVYNRFEYLPERASALAAWGRHVESIVAGKSGQVIPLAGRPAR